MKADYEETVRYCGGQQQKPGEVVVIGLMPNLRSPFLSGVCREFQKRHPHVEIRFKEYFREDYAAKLQAREFDVSVEYFMNYIHDIRGLQAEKLATASQVLLVTPDHPLAGKASIDFEDLKGRRFFLILCMSRDFPGLSLSLPPGTFPFRWDFITTGTAAPLSGSL